MNWGVKSMSKTNSIDGLNNVVVSVYYTCGTNSDPNNDFSFRVDLEPPSLDSFLDYESLTEADVLSWLPEDHKSNIENFVTNRSIDLIFEETLPWQ